MERDNPVRGAAVNSNNIYVKKFFGVPVYAHNHTLANILKDLDGKEHYNILVSSTNYSAYSKNLILNKLSELYLKRGNAITAIKLTSEDENGWCGYGSEGKPPPCSSTATAVFQIDKSLFSELAQADPSKPLALTAKLHDGSMQPCPLYFSPLSFQAPLSMIDEQFAKALEKCERQLAKRDD